MMKKLLFLTLALLVTATCASAQTRINNNQLPVDITVQGTFVLTPNTVSHLPAASTVKGALAAVTDGASTSDCTTGGGSNVVFCSSNGSIWLPLGVGGGGGTPGGSNRQLQFNSSGSFGGATGITTPDGSSLSISGNLTLPTTTVSGLGLASASPEAIRQVSDGVNADDCVTGGGSTLVTCRSNGSSWAPLASPSISGGVSNNLIKANSTTTGTDSGISFSEIDHPQGPNIHYDVTNPAYGSCSFNGTGDDTTCWNSALSAAAASFGQGHVYLPCGVTSKVTSSLNLSQSLSNYGWIVVELCGTLEPTGTITLAHGYKAIIGVPGTSAQQNPPAGHLPYTNISLANFSGTGPVIATANATDSNSYYFEKIGINGGCPGDCIQLSNTTSNQGVFATIKDSTFNVANSSTGACIDSYLGFGLDVTGSFCQGSSTNSRTGIVIHGTGQVRIIDDFFQRRGITYLTDYCPNAQDGMDEVSAIRTENLDDPQLIEANTTSGCSILITRIGPSIEMADNVSGQGLYLLNHTGDTSPVILHFDGLNPFTGYTSTVTNGSNITYTAEGLGGGVTGYQLTAGESITALGDKNQFGSCTGGSFSTGIGLTVCPANSNTTPKVANFIAETPSNNDGQIIGLFDKGGIESLGGFCTGTTFGGGCGNSGTGHAYGWQWVDRNNGTGFGVIRSEGITAGQQRNWKFPDYDLSVAGFDVAQNWTASQAFKNGLCWGPAGTTCFGSMDSANIGDFLCVTATGPVTAGRCQPGLPPDTQSTNSAYAIPAVDRGAIIVRTNTAAVSDTIAQNGTGGFTSNWFTNYWCHGTANCTITPTTSTINGNASITLQLGQFGTIETDSSGNNYTMTINGVGTISTPQLGQSSSATWAGTCTLGTNCAITFASAYASTPVCLGTDQTSAAAVKSAPSTTGVTLTGTGTDVIAWACFGNPN